jgi:hypothetical protein
MSAVAGTAPRTGERAWRERFGAVAWLIFAAASAAAAAVILWLGRDATFSSDELVWFIQTPGLDLDQALQPHAGHLILTSRLVYAGVFEIFGVDYLPFRLLTIGTVILTSALLFAYASRRVGRVVALAPALVLLVFGADYAHVLLGNGFTVVGALACGLGALLALDRGDRRGDVIACTLLCLGVLTYTVALAFVAGIGVAVLLRGDRWRRIWIVAIPVAIYAAWWLWALDAAGSSQEQLTLSDALLLPSWGFQSLSAVLGGLTGIDYAFGDESAGAAGALALAALIALGLRIRRGAVPLMLWAALGIVLAYWLMSVLGNSLLRTPDSPRYMYPGAIGVLVVATWALAGWRPTRFALVTVFVVAAAGVATNLILLRDGSDTLRAVATATEADFGALELAGQAADPGFSPDGSTTGSIPSAFALSAVRATGAPPTGSYLEAVERYGSIGTDPAQLATLDESGRARVDTLLARATGLAAQPLEPGTEPDGCVALAEAPATQLELAPGETAVVAAGGQAATVELRRFAESAAVEVGEVGPGAAATIVVPADAAPQPWRLSSPDDLRVCAAP